MSTLPAKVAKGFYALILIIFGRLFKTLPERPQGVVFKSEAIAYEYLQRRFAKHNRRMFRSILFFLFLLGTLITALIFLLLKLSS